MTGCTCTCIIHIDFYLTIENATNVANGLHVTHYVKGCTMFLKIKGSPYCLYHYDHRYMELYVHMYLHSMPMVI